MTIETDSPSNRCGHVAIIGRPNVGKSTLLNHLIGQPISIATRRAQTTRHRILAVDTEGPYQCIFLDTPGMHTHHDHKLNRHIHRAAVETLGLADLLIMVVDRYHWNDDDACVLQHLHEQKQPTMLVINKADQISDNARMQDHLNWLGQQHDFSYLTLLSARSPKQVKTLKAKIHQQLPLGGHLFDPDQITDRSWPFIACERVRAALMNALHDELPYSVHVSCEQWKEEGDQVDVALLIWVAKSNHKSMVIGKGGETLKRVGQRARIALARLMGKKVHMRLWVKVREHWHDNPDDLREAGY